MRPAAASGWQRGARCGLVVVALALVAAGCGAAATPSLDAGLAGDDPGVVHVHGLASDPDDPSTLYAATHTGLFRLPAEGDATRVGDHYHDLMGFTITEEAEYVASGHPDLNSDELLRPGRPPLLGLVTSPDRGASWTPRSLLGEVDFHALEARHGFLYGSDATSGRLMVSSDGRDWEARSTPGLLDVVLSPDDPEVLVGTGGGGLVRSENGGRSWSRIAALPAAALAWGETLWSAAPNGEVAASSDGGRSWEQRGSVGGQPEALLATGDELIAAVADRGIVASEDGGRTWSLRYASGGQG